MENYLEKYGSKGTRKFQQGGDMAGAEAQGAPAPEAGGAVDPQALLAEYAQTRDPQTAVAIAEALLAMMEQEQGGAPAEAGAPMYRQGGDMKPVFKR